MAHANAWRELSDPPWPADEADPTDTQILTEPLEERIDQLKAELIYWGRHKETCPARHTGTVMGIHFSSPSDCRCGLTEALEGRLWDGVGEGSLEKALEALETAEAAEEATP